MLGTRRYTTSSSVNQLRVTMHSVKPCPHWRLESPNSATVAVFRQQYTVRRLPPKSLTNSRRIVAVSGDYRRRTGLYRQTDERTNGRHDDANSRSYDTCVAVRLAKNFF